MDFLLKYNGAKCGIDFGVIRAGDLEAAQQLGIDWCRKNQARFCELKPLVLVDETPPLPEVKSKK